MDNFQKSNSTFSDACDLYVKCFKHKPKTQKILKKKSHKIARRNLTRLDNV